MLTPSFNIERLRIRCPGGPNRLPSRPGQSEAEAGKVRALEPANQRDEFNTGQANVRLASQRPILGRTDGDFGDGVAETRSDAQQPRKAGEVGGELRRVGDDGKQL